MAYRESMGIAAFLDSLSQSLGKYSDRKYKEKQDETAIERFLRQKSLESGGLEKEFSQLSPTTPTTDISAETGVAGASANPNFAFKPNKYGSQDSSPMDVQYSSKPTSSQVKQPLSLAEQQQYITSGKVPGANVVQKTPVAPTLPMAEEVRNAQGQVEKTVYKSDAALNIKRDEMNRKFDAADEAAKLAKSKVKSESEKVRIDALKEIVKNSGFASLVASDGSPAKIDADKQLESAMAELQKIAGTTTVLKTSFKTIAEAEASGLPKGTKITIGERPAVIE